MIFICCGRVDFKMISISWTINFIFVGLFIDLYREEIGFYKMLLNFYVFVVLRNVISVINICVNN